MKNEHKGKALEPGHDYEGFPDHCYQPCWGPPTSPEPSNVRGATDSGCLLPQSQRWQVKLAVVGAYCFCHSIPLLRGW